jgi:dTDP-4-dehydrorhamnose reductase
MRVLILGGSGMLGHTLYRVLSRRFDARTTFRRNPAAFAWTGMFDPARSLGGVVVEDFDSIVRAFAWARPDAVVNCVGIVKQAAAAKDPVPSLAVNSLYPHRLAQLCRAAGTRLVHVSTDCVFAGTRGNYAESDPPDATDLYGRSKLMGEVTGPGSLTLRTSIIGHEIESAQGLVEWFVRQRGGRCKGFRRAIFSGLPTVTLSGLIADVLEKQPGLEGLYQVAADPIDKYTLLCLVNEAYGAGVTIDPDETFACDRSLDGSRFRQATGFAAAAWPDLVRAMRDDAAEFLNLRRSRGN